MKDDSSDPVEQLMVRCLERPETEWPAALDAAAREYPEHAQELRARVRLLAGVDALLEAEEPRAFVPEDFGDFTGLCPIGRGGMGIVYRAHQVSLRREVAIKVIRPERLLQEGAIERFRREVETVAQLRSPHVVAIHSVGETRQGEARLPWFAMELLGGASLAGAIATIGPRAPETLTGADLFAAVGGEGHELPGHFEGSWVDGCLRTALQLTRALEHAHERGVLHRDVKPGNAILEPSGRTVLFDFGLTATRSTPSARLTESGQPVGTLVYMAPEQLRGADVDERADIYALGATLYELLTLLPPFEGSSALDLGRAIEAGAPSPIRARNRRVPVDAQTVCLTAMARAPRDRYASAAALARDLENVLAGRPIEARPPGPWTRARRWAQRHPAGAASAGLLATLLVGGPTVLFAQERVHNAALGRRAEVEAEAKAAALAANVELEDVLAFTLDLFEQAAPSRHKGEVPDAIEMLHAGSARLSGVSLHARSRARLDLALGRLFSVMTELDAAEPHLVAAIEGLSLDGSTGSKVRLAEALRLAAHNAGFRGDHGLAATRSERALALADEVHAGAPWRLAPFLATAADVAGGQGEAQAAVDLRRKMIAVLDAAPPETPRLEQDRAVSRGLLGVSLRELGALEEARTLLESAAAALDPENGSDANEDGAPGAQLERIWLELSTLERLAGDPQRALALAEEAHARLLEREGPESLTTLQAAYARAQALAGLDRHAEAVDFAEVAAEGMRPRLASDRSLLLIVESFRIGALTAVGRNQEVIDLCAEHGLLEAFALAFGVESDAHRKALRAHAMACQVKRLYVQAEASFAALEAAERALAPWSGDHAGAVLLLCAHRGQFMPERGKAPTIALLREAIEAIGDEALPVTSLANGQTFEAGYMARAFLAPLLEADPDLASEAAAIRAEAEERMRRVMAGG